MKNPATQRWPIARALRLRLATFPATRLNKPP
jgi:hypothetical protein